MYRAEAKTMPAIDRLEQDLQVAVGPLPQRALRPHRAARAEHLAQLDDEPLPLVVAELPVEVYGPCDADRQTEHRAPFAAASHIERQRGTGNGVRRQPNLAADRLQLGEGQPF